VARASLLAGGGLETAAAASLGAAAGIGSSACPSGCSDIFTNRHPDTMATSTHHRPIPREAASAAIPTYANAIAACGGRGAAVRLGSAPAPPSSRADSIPDSLSLCAGLIL